MVDQNPPPTYPRRAIPNTVRSTSAAARDCTAIPIASVKVPMPSATHIPSTSLLASLDGLVEIAEQFPPRSFGFDEEENRAFAFRAWLPCVTMSRRVSSMVADSYGEIKHGDRAYGGRDPEVFRLGVGTGRRSSDFRGPRVASGQGPLPQQGPRRGLSQGRGTSSQAVCLSLHRGDTTGRHRASAMSFPFNLQDRVILVDAELEGPTGSVVLRLALDTGATVTGDQRGGAGDRRLRSGPGAQPGSGDHRERG